MLDASITKARRAYRKARVLRWINRTRLNYGIGPKVARLPRADRRCCVSCVVAAGLTSPTTNPHVGIVEAALYQSTGERFPSIVEIALPGFVADFIVAFDRGEYPELLAAGAAA